MNPSSCSSALSRSPLGGSTIVASRASFFSYISVPIGNVVVVVFLLLPGMPTDDQYGPITS